ncbi:site-specific DNA-methyltransferase [bacterium]|nr:site-specific DNA-methyltransferase [bacterium]
MYSSLRSTSAQLREFIEFQQFGRRSDIDEVLGVPRIANEFWTSRQRAAHSLHEVSYRACFKPQLPRFFIERFSEPGDWVFDPYMGRGTTLLEAAFLGRTPMGCDINPLSQALLAPRLQPPSMADVEQRLAEIKWEQTENLPEELLVFYHSTTLQHLCSLRSYLQRGQLDVVDRWIQMVALTRLAGHSPGFFSVYTLPPNQAVSLESQRRINEKRNQVPPPRDVVQIIMRKSQSLLADLTTEQQKTLHQQAAGARLFTASSEQALAIPSQKVALVVTSPPFLDVVDYTLDNWLRCWFLGLNPGQVAPTVTRRESEWQNHITNVLCNCYRMLRPQGVVAFEVGEVRKASLEMERLVVPAARTAGFEPMCVLVNQQKFTKTANCWGVSNGNKGTNTNRIVLLRRT